jgi:hypothetical protein
LFFYRPDHPQKFHFYSPNRSPSGDQTLNARNALALPGQSFVKIFTLGERRRDPWKNSQQVEQEREISQETETFASEVGRAGKDAVQRS